MDKIKFYKYEEWELREGFDEEGVDDRLYEDKGGNLITGILEDFWYYEARDPRNNQYVENGKRS